MKISDVITKDVYVKAYENECGLEEFCIGPLDGRYAEGMTADVAHVVKLALQNHDKLVQTNKELIEALKRMTHPLYKPCGHDFSCICSQDNALEILNKAKELLND